MGDDQILRKYINRSGLGAEPDADTDAEGTEDMGPFGWLRGVRDRAISLELRKKDGSVLAINYGWIERVEFEPSEGITLCAGGKKISIKGRNLNAEARPHVRLFQGICRHRVPWVVEADRPESLKAGQAATLIEEIEW